MNTETLKGDINALVKKCAAGRYELSDADQRDLTRRVKAIQGEVYRMCMALMKARRETKEAVSRMRHLEENLMRTQHFYSDHLNAEMEEKNREVEELKHELRNSEIRSRNLEEYNDRLTEENQTLERIRRNLEYGRSLNNS